MRNLTTFLTFSAAVLAAAPAFGVYVTPKMGGGQQNAPMVMPNVLFDGTDLSVSGVIDMMGMPIADQPVLRPLSGDDEFNPDEPFGVLDGTAYNLQYGWNLDANSEFLPSGANIWIEETDATDGLMTYERGTYAPIFGTDGSDEKWLWDGVMAHNAYAVEPGMADYAASYRLYLGDNAGVALPGYGETSITLNWTSIPEPATLGLLTLAALPLVRRRC